MNLPATNPPLTPPRRGTGQPVVLPSWEGLGAGSGAQYAQDFRGGLALTHCPPFRKFEDVAAQLTDRPINTTPSDGN